MRMRIWLTILSIATFFACQKEDELSKARMLWGDWSIEETKTIYFNPTGMTMSKNVQTFDIQFNHGGDGFIKSIPYQKIVWAIQEDPDRLLLSKEIASFNGSKIYNTDLFSIGECSDEEITLHNQYITRNDSIDITTERRWLMTLK